VSNGPEVRVRWPTCALQRSTCCTVLYCTISLAGRNCCVHNCKQKVQYCTFRGTSRHGLPKAARSYRRQKWHFCLRKESLFLLYRRDETLRKSTRHNYLLHSTETLKDTVDVMSLLDLACSTPLQTAPSNRNSKSPTVCPILSLKSKQHSYMPALPMPCCTVLIVTPHTPPFLRPPKAKKSYLMYKNGRKNIELLARPLDSGGQYSCSYVFNISLV